MLAEGFLRVLCYREGRKFASASKRYKTQAHSHCTDPSNCVLSNSTDLKTDSAEAGKQSYYHCFAKM